MNADFSDDVLLHRYIFGATPGLGLANNFSHRVSLESNGLLLISTFGGGLLIFDTKGTLSVADDTLVVNYTNATTPSIATRWMWDAQYSEALGVIFVATDSAIDIISTNGTAFNAADDTKLGSYTTTSTIALPNIRTNRLFYDETSGFLYSTTDYWVNTTVNGLTVIDTKKTATLADDTLFVQYTQSDLGFSGFMRIASFTTDGSKNLIYLAVNYGDRSGLLKIDTKGTPTKADDVIERFSQENGLATDYAQVALIIDELNSIFVGTSSGVSVFTEGFQNLSATHYLRAYDSSLWDVNRVITWDALVATGTSVTAKVRM